MDNDEITRGVKRGSEQITNGDNGNTSKKLRRDCPYLDTVDRTKLDFDFEKICTVTLSTNNVYACLICGKFYQGRGKDTPANLHSLEFGHHVFIHLTTKHIYCLPDNYEVLESALDDIKTMVDPEFDDKFLQSIDKEPIIAYSLDKKSYTVGILGLNAINKGGTENVVIQLLAHVPKFRDYFLKQSNYMDNGKAPSSLVNILGLVIRKLWTPYHFRTHISPNEINQEISLRSGKKFGLGSAFDPVDMLTWLFHTIHKDFGTKKSIVTDAFQGQLQYNSTKQIKSKKKNEDGEYDYTEERQSKVIPFYFLSLDVPPVPLFKNEIERNNIPQQPIFNLLSKYNGETASFLPLTAESRTYIITKLPNYLVFHIKRFTKNDFFEEKNPTIVTFPLTKLDMKDYTTDRKGNTQYNLIGVVRHEGKKSEGQFRCTFLHKASKKWFDLQDLFIEEVVPQLLIVSEAYLLIYERDGNGMVE